jgi:hypothetical protein
MSKKSIIVLIYHSQKLLNHVFSIALRMYNAISESEILPRNLPGSTADIWIQGIQNECYPLSRNVRYALGCIL